MSHADHTGIDVFSCWLTLRIHRAKLWLSELPHRRQLKSGISRMAAMVRQADSAPTLPAMNTLSIEFTTLTRHMERLAQREEMLQRILGIVHLFNQAYGARLGELTRQHATSNVTPIIMPPAGQGRVH